MMSKEANSGTAIYIPQSDGSQVKVEFIHQSEPLPTPHEQPIERELTAMEFLDAKMKISMNQFNLKSKIK